MHMSLVNDFLGGGFFLGLFLSVLLFLRAYKGNRSEIFLGMILLVTSLNLIHPYFNFLFETRMIFTRYALFEPTQYLFSPLLFLYIRQLLYKNKRFSALSALHFVLPLILVFLSSLKLCYELEILFPFPLMSIIFWIILTIQAGVYLIRVHSMIKNYRESATDEFSNRKDIDKSWLEWFLRVYIFLCLTLLIPLFLLVHFNNPQLIKAFISFSSFLILWILGLKIVLQEREKPQNQPAKLPQVNKNLSMSREEEEMLLKGIEELLSQKELFLNPDLSLDDLVKALGFSRNEVSWIINKKLGKNFYQLINEYRVNRVKESLVSDDYREKTILEIALQSGFNSKPGFNKVFKELTGQTPSQFRKKP